MSVLFYLAYRTLIRSRISFVLLIAAVTAGLGFQIPNTANLDGYAAELRSKGIARDTGHVVISSKTGGSFSGAGAVAERLAALPFVRTVVVRFEHVGSVFIGERTESAPVVGVDPAVEERTMGFCSKLHAGRCIEAGDKREALVGFKLAEQLGARAGEKIRVALPFLTGDSMRMVTAEFEVAGVLEGTGGFRGDYHLFVPIDVLRKLFDKPDAATEMRVFSTDEQRAGEWAEKVSETLPDQKVEPWWEAHTFVRNAIEANRAMAAISTTMVVVAVMIPVLALLYIHVLAERRRIATIAALGFSRREIFLVHLFEALLVGGIGTVLGSLVGYAICRYFQAHPIFQHAGFVVLPSITIHAFLRPALVLFTTTLFAGLAPAVLASRAEPAIELRRE